MAVSDKQKSEVRLFLFILLCPQSIANQFVFLAKAEQSLLQTSLYEEKPIFLCWEPL